jgi:hypothetical protein
MIPARPLWQEQRGDRQCNPREERLELNAARLPPDLCQLRRIVDLLDVVAHLARASRRQAQSGLIALLEEPGRCAPEAQDQRKPPPAIHTTDHEGRKHDKAEAKLDQTAVQPLASLARADV